MDVNVLRYDDWMDRNEDFLEEDIMRKLKKEELDSYKCSFCESKDVSALFKTEFDARVYSCFKHQKNLVQWEKQSNNKS